MNTVDLTPFCKEEVIKEFSGYYDNSNEVENTLSGAELLVSFYEIDGYEGSAYVLYRKDGKLFEVEGSHCSCNGLEDCWGPVETTPAALKMKKSILPYGIGGYYSDNPTATEIAVKALVDSL